MNPEMGLDEKRLDISLLLCVDKAVSPKSKSNFAYDCFYLVKILSFELLFSNY